MDHIQTYICISYYVGVLWNIEKQIIKALAQVFFESVLVEAYKGTRRKHNMKLRQIGHTTSQYGQSFFPKTISAWNGLALAEAPSLAVF